METVPIAVFVVVLLVAFAGFFSHGMTGRAIGTIGNQMYYGTLEDGMRFLPDGIVYLLGRSFDSVEVTVTRLPLDASGESVLNANQGLGPVDYALIRMYLRSPDAENFAACFRTRSLAVNCWISTGDAYRSFLRGVIGTRSFTTRHLTRVQLRAEPSSYQTIASMLDES